MPGGLYMNPPDAAVVLCMDHKSQIQALDRTAPILPLLPGTPQRLTHDYKRNGTTNLGAALDTASGRVITSMTRRNRTQEFQKLLNLINREVSPRTRRPRRVGQRIAPQNRANRALAATPPPLHIPFHTHLRVVDVPKARVVLRVQDPVDFRSLPRWCADNAHRGVPARDDGSPVAVPSAWAGRNATRVGFCARNCHSRVLRWEAISKKGEGESTQRCGEDGGEPDDEGHPLGGSERGGSSNQPWIGLGC